MNNNVNVSVSYTEAKNCSSRMMDKVKLMQNILNELEEEVNKMSWAGVSADNFKRRIREIKPKLDDVYDNYISKLPEKIDASVLNYQKADEE